MLEFPQSSAQARREKTVGKQFKAVTHVYNDGDFDAIQLVGNESVPVGCNTEYLVKLIHKSDL